MSDDIRVKLFTKAGEEAYRLCKERNHTITGIDNLWTSVLASTLMELVVKECAGIYDKIDNGNLHMGTDNYLEALQKHFGDK